MNKTELINEKRKILERLGYISKERCELLSIAGRIKGDDENIPTNEEILSVDKILQELQIEEVKLNQRLQNINIELTP